MHSVIQSDREVQPPALKYTGKGLELGDCTVEIKASNETDAGQWSCHMGVANGPELETNFKVFIKGKRIMFLFVHIVGIVIYNILFLLTRESLDYIHKQGTGTK